MKPAVENTRHPINPERVECFDYNLYSTLSGLFDPSFAMCPGFTPGAIYIAALRALQELQNLCGAPLLLRGSLWPFAQ